MYVHQRVYLRRSIVRRHDNNLYVYDFCRIFSLNYSVPLYTSYRIVSLYLPETKNKLILITTYISATIRRVRIHYSITVHARTIYVSMHRYRVHDSAYTP